MAKRMLAVLLALVIAALCACGPKEEAEKAPPAQAETAEEPSSGGEYVRATLHCVSDDGFIVPVTKLVPREEGIAKACLSYMVASPENVSAWREMGLNPVIPAGTEISLSITEGNACVDLGGVAPMESAEAELAMVQAVVNTLTGFPTVSTVTITRDGKGGALENGVTLPERQGEYPLNPEAAESAVSSGGVTAILYFPNGSGALTVPVARRLERGDVYSVVSALVKGASSPRLRSCFPENTLLLGAALENGVVTVDLSDDIRAASETEGAFMLAYETTYLTLAERFDIDRLVFRVNGREYAPEPVSPPEAVNPAWVGRG